MTIPLWTFDRVTLAGRVSPRLADISLSIPQGVTGIVGESGAGKTSLLNLLVEYERPVSGRVNRGDSPSGRLPYFWVPQDDGLWPGVTVRRHLELVQPSAPCESVEELLPSFDLVGIAEATPERLSRGEASRVAIARAVASEARVLVLDEPLTHVDGGRRGRYWERLLKSVEECESSLVFASHDPADVLRYASHVIGVRNARIAFAGRVQSLYQAPPDAETAALLGPTNWLTDAEQNQWQLQGHAESCCVRPERLQVEPAVGGAASVVSSLAGGIVDESELRCEATGEVRRFLHRPPRKPLARGAKVRLSALALLIAAICMGCDEGATGPELAITSDRHFSLPVKGSDLPAPRDIALGRNDEKIVLDNGGRVLVYDTNGKLDRQWEMPESSVGNPEGACVLADGGVCVADTHYHRIVFFDSVGHVTGMFGEHGKDPGQFIYPVAVTTDPSGNLYVAEYGSNDRIQKFATDHSFLTQFGSFGTGEGQFQRPSGIVWLDGKIYCVDAFNSRIHVFSDSGDYQGLLDTHAAGLHYPYDLSLGPGNRLYIVEYGEGRVTVVSTDGEVLGRIGSTGSGQRQFATPWGLAVDSKGRIWVADTGNRRIVELVPRDAEELQSLSMIGGGAMNRLRSYFLRVFPPPRKAVRWIDAWPLALFLVAFIGIVVWLDATGRMLFERPLWFGLLIVTPWIWWMSIAGVGGLSAGRAATATLIRLCLAGLLVMVLAEPRSVRTSNRLSVVYAMDISDSIGEITGEAAREFFARTVSEKPSGDWAGLVVFGRNAAVEFPPREAPPPDDTAINSLIEPDATNLEQALSLSAAMLPEDSRGRIVLVSDGTATEGSLSRVLDELKSRGVSVDVLPIQYDFDREVWLERLELPRQVKLGENYEAAVVLASLKEGKGKLVLRENGEVIAEKEVEFRAGKNRFTVPIMLREPAYYEYTATIETNPDEDHLQQNNTVVSYLFVEGEGKVLLVTSPEAEGREWQKLAKTLRDADRLVEQVSSYDLPRDVLALMPYDCIMFVDTPADAFDAVQMQAVHDAVKNLGIGFVMVGGPNSYGPGGYHRTVIEDALPVSMDVTKRKVLPKAALAIILHTCEFPEGNTWGKRITKEAIRVLGAQDEVGVLAYTQNGEEWVFELTPAGDYNKMVPKINAAQIGDMPSFANTMQLGLKGLEANDAATKHMIIISDGDPSPAPPELVQKFIEAKISVSTVAIFPHGGSEISNLRAVAAATGGRYYYPSDPNALPAIFIKEAKTLKRTMIQNKTVQPEFEYGLHPILKGIDSLPPLHGYVLVSAKGKPAQTLLKVPSDEKVAPGEVDPILSVWQYGLGRSAAWTSDLSPNWGRDWLAWEQFEPFVKQLVQHVSRVEKQGHLRVSTETEGNAGVIIAEDFNPEEMFLDVTATVVGPRGRTESVQLRQVGPRRYQAKMPLWGEGRYQVLVKGRAGERTEQVPAGFIVPYSPEYLRFRSNPIALEEIARKTGGNFYRDGKATSEEIFPTDRQPKSSSNPVFDWFLVALACLLPLDIAVRRVQLDWRAIAGAFKRRKADGSGATMGRLLDRKREVKQGLATPPVARPATARPSIRSRPAATMKTKVAPQPQRTVSPKPSGEGSTTSRLLDRKRKREEDQKPEDE